MRTNSELVIKSISPTTVDGLFGSATAYSGEAIVHFIRALSDVSLAELNLQSAESPMAANKTRRNSVTSTIMTNMTSILATQDLQVVPLGPSAFSLQMLVAVATAFVHSTSSASAASDKRAVWAVLSRYFQIVTTQHYDRKVVAFAQESLQKLSGLYA